jgi:N-acetyl-anhydromuramoyl-L-alanine amidase
MVMHPMSQPEPAGQSALWRDGWYQFAARRDSPNFGPRPANALPDLIVLHCISLPPGHYGGDEVERLFTNRLDWTLHPYFKSIEGMMVSSHFYIRRHGELMQFVSADDRAWHAGVSSYRGRGNCNDDSIGIELEGVEGGLFEDCQYESLVGLCAALFQRYAITDIAGHEHIAPGRKTDPGRGLDWLRLQQSLGLSPQCFPAGLVSASVR